MHHLSYHSFCLSLPALSLYPSDSTKTFFQQTSPAAGTRGHKPKQVISLCLVFSNTYTHPKYVTQMYGLHVYFFKKS